MSGAIRGAIDGWVARRRASIDPGIPAHDEFVCNVRGWRLPLRRLRASGVAGGRSGPPVVLCHGLGGNGRSMTLPTTLGPALSSRGFDVWIAELPSTRASVAPVDRDRCDVDARLWADSAALVAYTVATEAGVPLVDWVGHSLGAWAAIVAGDHAPVRRVVALGATLHFDANRALAKALSAARLIGRTLGGGKRVPQSTLGAIEAPFMGRFELPEALSFVSPSGLDPALTRQLHALAVEDLPMGILDDVARWCEGDASTIAPWLAAARRSSAEVLFVAGERDLWAPPANVERSTIALASRGARMIVARGYTHQQLAFGPERPSDVDGAIREWLSGTVL